MRPAALDGLLLCDGVSPLRVGTRQWVLLYFHSIDSLPPLFVVCSFRWEVAWVAWAGLFLLLLVWSLLLWSLLLCVGLGVGVPPFYEFGVNGLAEAGGWSLVADGCCKSFLQPAP